MDTIYFSKKQVEFINLRISDPKAPPRVHAIVAGYSKVSAPQQAQSLMKNPKILAAIAKGEKIETSMSVADINPKAVPGVYDDPEDFLKAVMNNPGNKLSDRINAAGKLISSKNNTGKKGKKELQKETSADKTSDGNHFAPNKVPSGN